MYQHERAAAVAWPLALAAAAIVGSLATACMMPFVAVATLTSVTMTRTQALTAVLGVWIVNQLLGFGLLGYPVSTYAVGWGVAIGLASVVALFVARRLGGSSPSAGRLVITFAAAFAGYETVLYIFALAAGGSGTFTPAIVLRILANDAAWLVGLAALHILLTRAAPRIFGQLSVLRPV